MIKHIVVWRLNEYSHGNAKEANARIIKQKLESLNGKIPGLIKIEVGINFSTQDNCSDIVLYSEFETKEDLERYQAHKLHTEIMPFIQECRNERRMVDYVV